MSGLCSARDGALVASLDRWIARSSTLDRQPEVELDMRLPVGKGPAQPGLETGPVRRHMVFERLPTLKNRDLAQWLPHSWRPATSIVEPAAATAAKNMATA